MREENQPRNRAERRAAGRRARGAAAVGSGAMLAFGAAGVATTSLSSTPASAAAPIVVTSLADTGPGSLRDAIDQANTAAGQDTITFQTGLSGTITLASDLPHITDALAIDGPGASVVTVDGANAFAVFNFYGVTSADGFDSLSGLTVTHGVAHNNDNSSGGAVLTRNTSADLTIADAVLTDNYASNDGGAVQAYNASGTVTITGSVLSDNRAGGGGGAFYSTSSDLNVVISNSTVSGNTAGGFGGGFYVRSGALTVENSTISGNTAGTLGRGGGIRIAAGTLDVTNSTISGNTARDGGGIHVYDANASVTATTISGNTASGGGGGGIMVHYDSGTGATFAMRNSTVSGNRSQYYGGGLYVANSGQATIENSTISGNDAAQAGGLFSYGGGSTLTQVTISDNSASAPKRGNPAVGGVLISTTPPTAASRSGAEHAEGAASTKTPAETERLGAAGPGGVHATMADTVDATGTIVAGNAGDDIGAFRGGLDATLNSDHSVLGTVEAAVIVNDQGGTQQNVADAGLAPLGDNGGPTHTMALRPGSVAIDAGPVPVPVFPGNEFDQRGAGFARVVGGAVDVGAYEVQPPEAGPPSDQAPAPIVITPRFTG